MLLLKAVSVMAWLFFLGQIELLRIWSIRTVLMNSCERKLAETLVYALRHHYVQTANFYCIGGMKIFRNLIYLMQGMIVPYRKVVDRNAG